MGQYVGSKSVKMYVKTEDESMGGVDDHVISRRAGCCGAGIVPCVQSGSICCYIPMSLNNDTITVGDFA